MFKTRIFSKRTFTSITVVALFASFFVLSLAFSRGESNRGASLMRAVQAQEVERATEANGERAGASLRPGRCTAFGVAGKYGITSQGIVLPPNVPAVTSAVAVGWIEVDFLGNVTGADTLSLGGQILPRTFTGTLTVKSDCTFTSQLTVTSGPLTGLVINSNGVVVSDSNEIHFVETDPGTIFTAIAKRM